MCGFKTVYIMRFQKSTFFLQLDWFNDIIIMVNFVETGCTYMNSPIKLLVISDTHKNISDAIDIISRRKPDYVLHLGDLADDADDIKHIFPDVDVIGVCGNCDWASFTNSPAERMLDIDGVKLLMCHGHIYNVKNGISAYVEYARGKGADVALFGHTHKPLLDNIGDIIIMNPGTVSTYGWLEIINGKVDARMCCAEE